MKNEASAIKVKNLSVAYDEKLVLSNINLEIPHGTLAAILGPNGAGKTTLIKTMLGLVKPLSGTVDFGGIYTKNPKPNIAYVPQSSSVDWDFPSTVLDIVTMGRYGHLGWFKRAKKSDRQMALDTLKKVGMEQYSTRQISELSGGQQQRVFLARALVQQADIYLLDEPFKGVDAQTEKSIVALLKELKASGKTVIAVHHDLNTVEQYFDWVTLININLIANGTVSDTFNSENLIYTHSGKAPHTDGESPNKESPCAHCPTPITRIRYKKGAV